MRCLIALFALISLNCCIQGSAKQCVFCKPEIIEKQSVFETESFHILLDYEPRVPGHLLAIPKRHVAKAHELSGKEWSELSAITQKTEKIFSKFLKTSDYIILEKNGRNAFQQVPHVHFHFFPVHVETWAEIFDIVPDRLSPEELQRQVLLFRSYFNDDSEEEHKNH